jgi:hypothetical protein
MTEPCEVCPFKGCEGCEYQGGTAEPQGNWAILRYTWRTTTAAPVIAVDAAMKSPGPDHRTVKES